MKLTRISDCEVGQSCKGFYQLTQMNRRTTRKKEPFLDCLLSDRTGSLPAKWWNVPEAAFDWLHPGMVVAATGEVEEYQNSVQLIVDQITPAKEGQLKKFGLSYSDVIPSSRYDIDQMWEDIEELIADIENESLRELTRQIFREFEEEIRTHPGSVHHHHLFRGGFLEHVWSLAHLGEFVADHYYELRRDLFLTGLLLHDIGKVLEIKSDADPQYTDEGRFIGHVILGRDLIRETVEKHFPEFPDDLLIQLEHIILAHQRGPDHGSPRRPATLEALVISQLDHLDTEIEQFLSALRNDPNQGNWTLPGRKFPYPLFKGGWGDQE